MQKDPTDSEHLSYLAGSTGYPGILPPDRGIVVDIGNGRFVCSIISRSNTSLTWVLKHKELRSYNLSDRKILPPHTGRKDEIAFV